MLQVRTIHSEAALSGANDRHLGIGGREQRVVRDPGFPDQHFTVADEPSVKVVEAAAVCARLDPQYHDAAEPAPAEHPLQRHGLRQAAGFAREPRRRAVHRARQTAGAQVFVRR